MASAMLEKVLEQVKALMPDELREVREAIDNLLVQKEETGKVDALHQALLAAGVISEIKPPITDFTPYKNRKLIEVKGKPLSETIIEERR